jgi:pimeloyl-ACP methyl ester carboxylesterase
MKSLLKRIGPMILLATISSPASAQQAPTAFEQPPFTPPDDVSVRKATIWSEGTRLSASLYSPKGAVGKLPTIIMAYGWGGTMERIRIEGAKFAKAGYLVVMFDHRGWGESDGRVILAAPAPAERHGNRFTAEVVELREIRDPLADVEDLFNVVHWVQAEPQSDTSRIGIWGTSFGGGIAAYVAGFDHRIKAIHAQVAPLELRALDRLGYGDGTKRTRGELEYPKPGLVVVSGLLGAPIAEHFIRYSPAQTLMARTRLRRAGSCLPARRSCSTPALSSRLTKTSGAPKKNLVTIPDIGHYDIYGKAHDEADRLALAWFDKNLK